MKFDSKVVIPTQFVLFNLSAIVGSAVLYGDFRKATFHQMVTFLYGCGATFAGVFMLTWGSASHDEDDLEDGTDREHSGQSAPASPTRARAGTRAMPILRNRTSTSTVPKKASPSNSISKIFENLLLILFFKN